MRCFLTLCTMAIPFLRRSTSAAADAVERTSFPPAPPVVRSPLRVCASLLLPSGRAVSARPPFSRIARAAAHKLRTNAKTGRGKCSDLHNLENHSQKVLYKCGSPCYLNISNNSCY